MNALSMPNLRAAHAQLETLRVAYRAAVLQAVRAIVAENVATRLDESLTHINWLTHSSGDTLGTARELEETLDEFSPAVQPAIREVIARLEALGEQADVVRSMRRVLPR